jgi:hypothetical protein
MFNKRVQGYENEKVQTCRNQTVVAETIKVSASTNNHTITEELLKMVISLRTFPKL